MTKHFILPAVLTITTSLAPQLYAQVQTEVPPVVPDAKPVTVERIKIHGTSLEGNLEKNVVDREVFVFRDPQGKVKVLHRKKDGKMELIEVP